MLVKNTLIKPDILGSIKTWRFGNDKTWHNGISLNTTCAITSYRWYARNNSYMQIVYVTFYL